MHFTVTGSGLKLFFSLKFHFLPPKVNPASAGSVTTEPIYSCLSYIAMFFRKFKENKSSKRNALLLLLRLLIILKTFLLCLLSPQGRRRWAYFRPCFFLFLFLSFFLPACLCPSVHLSFERAKLSNSSSSNRRGRERERERAESEECVSRIVADIPSSRQEREKRRTSEIKKTSSSLACNCDLLLLLRSFWLLAMFHNYLSEQINTLGDR